MPQLSFTFDAGAVGRRKFERNLKRDQGRVRAAMKQTAEAAAHEILAEGTADIRAAGNYGQRWTEGLHADVTGTPDNTVIRVTHDISYFPFLLKGGLIKGKPLLWIPLPWASEAKGTPASQYPGRLVRVNRTSGNPLLINPVDHQAKYVGVRSVRIAQKFHLLAIIRRISANLRQSYAGFFAGATGAE